MLVVICCCLSQTAVRAQDKFQPLIQRIALLKLYLGYAEKGYTIVRDGWSLVRDVTDGEFSLHDVFFKSLAAVNPFIRKSREVQAIVQMQTLIIRLCRRLMAIQGTNEGEIKYVNKVCLHVMRQVEEEAKFLDQLISGNDLEMTDDERMQQMNTLYAKVKEEYAFMQHFSKEWKLLVKLRRQEEKDVKLLEGLYGQ